ncbi:MAG: hypothetical protein JWP11_245 [Frankiales bacterium]|nr:hypothetical protein [Frankiales bacterium]
MKYDRPIHELLKDAAAQLTEPFSAKDIVAWFNAHYPDVATSAVRAHIQAMTGNVQNREENHPYLGARPPVLRRVGHGVYVRWSGSAIADRLSAVVSKTVPSIAQVAAAAASRADPVPLAHSEEWFWEGNVQSRLLSHLVSQGWDVVRVADTRSRESGTDVIARRGGRLLHVEVKGWPSAAYRDPAKAHLKKPTLPATQARVWFNDAVVHGLRLREAHPEDEVALCFPDKDTYRALCRGIAGSLRKCDVDLLVVDVDGRVSEV